MAMKLQLQLLAVILCLLSTVNSHAQECPPNIDFETGSFANWTCYTGSTSAAGDQNIMSLFPTGGPVWNRHTMYSAATDAGVMDPYGNFPVVCPNGSGHSIRLGNNTAGGEAEGISYEFTIPPNENSYSLIYHYAVVFQSPNHRPSEQPRMEIEITNVTDDTLIGCSSFTFIASGTSMPGFAASSVTDTTLVLYKNWTPVSINLSGNAGKTIRLFFKTGDCTFIRHFGYAYIDVNSECSNTILGASYCPGDTLVQLTAPFGYQGYAWQDSALTRILGTDQTLTLKPPPAAGSSIAVELLPYDGYGCPIVLRTQLKNNLTIKSDAGRDTLSCNRSPVLIGSNSRFGLNYQWSPAAGLSNPLISNPIATPDVTTAYVLKVSSPGGGCTVADTVIVQASIIQNELEIIGKDSFCIDNGDSAVLTIRSGDAVQWFKNDGEINGATTPTYRVATSGTYYARLQNDLGCTAVTESKTIVMEKAKPGITYPDIYAVRNLPLQLEARRIGQDVLWTPATNLDNNQSFTPVFRGASEQRYILEIRTATECLTIDTLLVKIVANVEIYVPNAFTPNGDGRNDFLRPHLRGIKELRYFKVFNRWGQLLFERKAEEVGWDGTFKGIPQQTETVVWMLEGVGVDGVLYRRKGTSTLIR